MAPESPCIALRGSLAHVWSLLDAITGGKFDPPRRPKKSDFQIRLFKDTLRASYHKITRPGGPAVSAQVPCWALGQPLGVACGPQEGSVEVPLEPLSVLRALLGPSGMVLGASRWRLAVCHLGLRKRARSGTPSDKPMGSHWGSDCSVFRENAEPF